MSKKIRQLIILLVVVVLIGAMTVAITLIPAENGGESSSGSSENPSSTDEDVVCLYEREETDIDVMTLKNETGTYEFTTTYDKDKEKVVYAITGYEGIDFFTNMCDKVSAFAQKLEVIKELGAQDDLEQFGLAEADASRFTVTYHDGTKNDILIGGTLNSNEEQRYAVQAGSNEVFVVEVNQLMEITPDTLLSALLLSIEATDSTGETIITPEFYSIKLSGRDHAKPIVIRRTDELDLDASYALYNSSYYIDGDPRLPVSPEATTGFLLDMCSIQSTGVVEVNPTEAVKAKYGLDNPIYLDVQVIATTDADGNPDEIDDYRVMIGDINEKEGYAYAMSSKRNVIYTINTKCIAIATMSAYDMRDALMYALYTNAVSGMKIEVGGNTYDFIRDRIAKETTTSSGETKVTYTYETYLNNELMSEFGSFYTQFMACYAESAPTGNEVKGELLFKATISHYDELKKDNTVICIYASDDDRRVLYEVDGEVIGLAQKSWINKVLSDVELLVNGKEVTPNL